MIDSHQVPTTDRRDITKACHLVPSVARQGFDGGAPLGNSENDRLVLEYGKSQGTGRAPKGLNLNIFDRGVLVCVKWHSSQSYALSALCSLHVTHMVGSSGNLGVAVVLIAPCP
jgi:hypothetical protein